MTHLQTITDRLTFLLRLHGKGGTRTRRMTYTSLPLTSDLKFEGTPLRTIMSPDVPEDAFGCEQIFDTWLSPLKDGEGNCTEDLIALAGKPLYEFISFEGAGRSVTFQEATVRLLYALSRHGCLVYSDRSIEVYIGDRTFGIHDGIVTSRFCTGLDLGRNIKPAEVLESTGEVRSFDRFFCSLCREAYRRGKGLTNALIALHMGNPGFNWRKLAEAARPAQRPSYAMMDRWEKTLLRGKDPISTLYTLLVPLWMTGAEFSKAIGRLSARPLELSDVQKQECITKLHNFFHKNK